MENDTIRLLRECNAGIKMGVSTLDDVMEHVQSDSLRNLLAKSKETHTRLGNTTHEYLREFLTLTQVYSALSRCIFYFLPI